MMNLPEHETELTPEEAVRRMAVDHLPGVYMLSAGFEKRMSTIAQQIRAVSLVGTLFEQNKVARGSKVAVVGAGAAGVTAATLAAWRGAEVHVFEKNPNALSTYADSNRLIHPRLYEWPDKDWSKGDAALPLLNWSADTGREVTRNLREQWDWWLDLFGCPNSKEQRLFWYPKTPLLDEPCGPDANDEYALRTRGGRMSGFQVVIIAVGFGPLQLLESIKSDEPWIYGYWAEKPAIPENATIAVSGRNDSGLTEAIELAAVVCIEGEMRPLDQATLPLLLQMRDFDSLRPELESMEATLQKGYRQIPPNAPDRLERITKIESQAFETLLEIGRPIIDQLVSDGRIQCVDSRQVFLLRRGDPDLTSDAFVLNRFVAAHLIRRRWITVIPHIDAQKYAREADGTFRAPGIESPIEILLIRHGPGPVPETRIVEERWRQQLATQGLTGPGTRFGIARRRSPQPDSANDRILLSDLYDSTTQAQVFEALRFEQKCEEAAAKELVKLYQSRLFLEFVRRDHVIVTDTQFFDGAFFLRWIPTLSAEERRFVGSRLTVRCRTKNPQACIREFLLKNGGAFKAFESSAIRDPVHRRELAAAMMVADDAGTRVPEDLDKTPEVLGDLSKDALQSWDELRELHDGLLKCLQEDCDDDDLVSFFDLASPSNRGKFDQLSATEDPADFAQRLNEFPDAKEVFVAMFRKPPQGEQYRSHFYALCDKISNSESEAKESVRAYYDRSYNRTIARQHEATVFETVRVDGIPRHTQRGEIERDHRVIKTRTSIDELKRQTEWHARLREQQTLILGEPTETAANRVPDNLGRQVLVLLRGHDVSIRRLWPDEAFEVGALVPAVIDEEYMSETRLCRVEYRHDIARNNELDCSR